MAGDPKLVGAIQTYIPKSSPQPNPIGELVITGIVKSGGIDHGKALIITKNDLQVGYSRDRILPDQVEAEIDRLDIAIVNIRKKFEETLPSASPMEEFDIRRRIGMYTKADRLDQIKERISTMHMNVCQAVDEVLGALIEANSDDDHFRNEMEGMKVKILSELGGCEVIAVKKLTEADRNYVLFADSILPEWIFIGTRGDKRLHGIVTVRSESRTHAVDDAVHHRIPMVAKAFFHEDNMLGQVKDGDPVIVDGTHGKVYIRPGADTVNKFRQFIRKGNSHKSVKLEGPPKTLDNDTIHVYIAGSYWSEIEQGVELGSPHLGLPRTERLYLNSFKEGEPVVLPFFRMEQMIEDYSRINKMLAVAGGQCQWRTFDFSYDKGENLMASLISKLPAHLQEGRSSSDLMLDYVYAPQIRALLIAGQHHDSLRIYFPFVGSGLQYANRIAMVQAQLQILRMDTSNPLFNRNPSLGAMVETYQGARNLSHIIEHKPSHLCFGTNDFLTSIVGGDRLNGTDGAAEPALLELLENAVSTVNKVNEEIEVSVCGNLARPPYLPLLYGIGIRRVSVRPTEFSDHAKIASILKLDECKELLREAKKHQTAAGVDAILRSFYTRKGLDQTFW